MAQGVINQPVIEFFSVADQNGDPVLGLDSTAFVTYVYNPSDVEVSDSVSESISELGNGNYKYIFTPNVLGSWYVVLINSIYFPSGKSDQVEVVNADLSILYSDIQKLLGLSHRNFYIDDTLYDEFGNMISARIRIYSDAVSVGTTSNVIETYTIETEGEQCGQFTYWKQVVNP